MQADELLKSGDLDGALAVLQDAVRGDASNPKLRIFLFQLLCVRGEWKRAIAQLKVSAEMDPEALAMAQTYREGIICEVYREKVFAGEKSPMLFGEPQEWMALMSQALKAQAGGNTDQAAEMRGKAFEMAPTASGEINGERFEWIADADMRLGPLLEVVVDGKYFWMPFDAIDTALFEAPADLRDAVWTPCTLKLTTGGEVVGLIPTRYAGTAETGDATEKLARATNWADAGADTFVGKGQRLLTTDTGDTAIMDVRLLKIDASAQDVVSDG